MTQAVFQSYRFDVHHKPSEEQLGQLMENAAEKVELYKQFEWDATRTFL